jgi:hypothetical protein
MNVCYLVPFFQIVKEGNEVVAYLKLQTVFFIL